MYLFIVTCSIRTLYIADIYITCLSLALASSSPKDWLQIIGLHLKNFALHCNNLQTFFTAVFRGVCAQTLHPARSNTRPYIKLM